jgi:hypothetical protein
MIDTLLTFRAPPLLSPRTANYVAALIRQGDNFDYYEWLYRAREEEAWPRHTPTTCTPSELTAAEMGDISPGCRGAWPSSGGASITKAVPVPRGLWQSAHDSGGKTAGSRATRSLEKVRDAWDDFQASRARDAVYGYFGGCLRNRRALQSTAKDREASASCVPIRYSSLRQERRSIHCRHSLHV